MPIFTYVVVVSVGLTALLFILDATLEKAPPAIVTSERGLPEPFHPNPVQVLTATPAPAPDVTSEAVLAAQANVEPAPVAKQEPAPNKRHTTRRQPRDDYRQSYGSSQGRVGFFGGFFGR